MSKLFYITNERGFKNEFYLLQPLRCCIQYTTLFSLRKASAYKKQTPAVLKAHRGLMAIPILFLFQGTTASRHRHILPSEKAKAYEMKLEAIRRKAGRPSKENSRQVVGDFESADLVGQASGESGRQVQRFIRLNKLTPELMKMVDDGKLKTTPAVELSYLTPEEQEDFLSYMESEGCTPSLSQAQKLKEASKESVLTSEKIQHIMAAKPPSVKPRDPQLMIPVAKVERYFPKGFTSDQMQQVIVKLLENYARAHQHGSR